MRNTLLRGLCLLAGTSIAFSPPASAKTPAADALRALPTPAEAAWEVRGNARVELETGIPRALYAVNQKMRHDAPVAMARQFLSQNHALLHLANATLTDLEHRSTRDGDITSVVRFGQVVQGLPVLESEITVTLDRQDRVVFVMNSYQPEVSVPTTTPSVAASAARNAALAHLQVAGGLNLDSSRLAILPQEDGARLVWEVKIVPQETPTGDWEVLVDARTGEIVRVSDHACHATGNGNVFDADPLSSAHVAYNAPGYTDGADANTAQLTSQLHNVTLNDITFSAGVHSLVGPYAAINDAEAPFFGLFSQASSTFNFNRTDNAFEAVNCYYHVDHVMRFINETLGITLMPNEYSGGVRFDPHGLSGADNSHYIPSTGQLAWGEGGVDDAEDSDVVIHELGHGLHDWVTGGGLSQVNGLSEGVGDYFAQSYSRSLNQWVSTDAAFHWVFNWDGHNPFWAGRITNYGATYPGGLVNQVHSDGQIWASCLMRIWNQVGRNKMDAAHLEGLAMTNGSSNQNDAANAVAIAASLLPFTSPEMNALLTEMATTGYTVAANLDFVSQAGIDDCPANPANNNSVWEPGETVAVPVTLRSSLLTRTNAVGTLTTSTPGVTILDGTATWPTLTGGVAIQTDAPHFLVHLDETMTCFSTISFNLVVTTNETGPHNFSFSQPVGEGLIPAGLPLAIPNNNATGVTSTLTVGQSVALSDLNVRVQINHNWVGDLKLQLQSPAGTTITLLDRPGFPNTANGCNNDNMDVTFDSASAFNLENHCAGTTPWYQGVAAPTQSLNVFNGQSTVGTWKLIVVDAVAGGTGSLVSWELLSTPSLLTACEVCPEATDAPAIVTGGARFELQPGRPNPFTDQTEIRFSLGRASATSLRVVDVTGREVTTLIDRTLPAGSHSVTWNGTDVSGQPVASGIYFYRLSSDEGTALQRMQFVR